MIRLLLAILALGLAGCLGPPKAPGEPPNKKSETTRPDRADPKGSKAKEDAKKSPTTLPAGFLVTRPPRLQASVEEPAAFWRFIVSYLATLRADARRKGQDLLVTFVGDAIHVTERSGERRTWRLPGGLTLAGIPAHVVLQADLGVAVYGPDGTQLPPADEITILTARVQGGQEFRLVVKGGARFRSISNPG